MKIRDCNSYFKECYGSKTYKVGISLNVTCPNRDGRFGTGGCKFCSAGGSGEFSESSLLSVTSQIDSGISKLKNKCKEDTSYIAYFQSFTNTYCEPEVLRKALYEAINHPKVVAVSLATRPDCLPDEIIKVLADFVLDTKSSSEVPRLYVELGLQTIDDEVAREFNRCYPTTQYDEAVNKLKSIGVNVITHLIFGLPGETRKMNMNSVRHIKEIGTDGVKFTCLYVLKGTEYETLWDRGELKVLNMEEYFDLVENAINILGEDIIIHRFTGDGPKSLLLAPSWTSNKRNVVNYINRRFQNK